MNIVYNLNNKFIPQVAASITSICENNQNSKTITFYLLHTDIKNSNQNKLKKHVLKYGHKIRFIKLKNIKEYLDFNFDTTGWNPIILGRLFLDKLLPKNIDRILYLDGDTIAKGDLQELYSTNMDKYAIAAVIEPTVDKKRKAKLGLKGCPYYNSGVLLINLKKWREDATGERIINYYKKQKGNLFAPDQDAINGSEKNKILTLSPKYNFFNALYQYPYRFLSNLSDFEYISKKAYNDAKKNPIIIHFLGEERPWRIGNHHKYKDDYLKYLNLTPWQNQNLEKGWRLYFVCWDCFNLITKPFPKLRYTVINTLIPTFMKHRSKQLIKNHEK